MPPNLKESSYSLRGFLLLMKFFKFCGVAPISVRIDATGDKKNEEGKTLVFSYSKWEIIYNIVLVCVFIGCGISAFPNIYKTIYRDFIIHIVHDILTAAGLSSTCMVILIGCVKQKSALQLFDKMQKVNQSLIEHNSSTTGAAFLLCVIIFNLHVLLWIIVITSEIITFKYSITYGIVYVGTMLVIYIFFMQYAVVVMLIKRRFQTANRVLSNLTTIARIEVSSPLSRYALGTNSTVIQLRTLSNMHSELCEICYELEKLYSLPIFVGIGAYFPSVLYDSYNLVSSFSESFVSDISVSHTLNSIIWLIVDITPLFFLSYNITALKNETKKTGLILQKLFSRKLKVEIAAELRQFSLQLLHHDVQFSAYGFFSIDLTLVHSIMNATATYVVILFQLQT